MTLSKENLTLDIGEKHRLVATVDSSECVNYVEFISQDMSICSVDSFGNVTALSKGETDTIAHTDIGTTMTSGFSPDMLKDDFSSMTWKDKLSYQVSAYETLTEFVPEEILEKLPTVPFQYANRTVGTKTNGTIDEVYVDVPYGVVGSEGQAEVDEIISEFKKR